MRSWKTEVSAPERLGLGLFELLTVAEGERETDLLGEAEKDWLAVWLTEGEGDHDELAEMLPEGEGDFDSEALVKRPSSIKAWLQSKLSISRLISRFAPNLKDPGIPLSS